MMVTHDPAMARLADRTIRLHHGRVIDERIFPNDDREQFDDLLEEIWIIGEQGEIAAIGRLEGRSALPPSIAVERMAEFGLVTLKMHDPQRQPRRSVNGPCHEAIRSHSEIPAYGENIVALTPRGLDLAERIVRRHRLAERLLVESFHMSDRRDIEARGVHVRAHSVGRGDQEDLFVSRPSHEVASTLIKSPIRAAMTRSKPLRPQVVKAGVGVVV